MVKLLTHQLNGQKAVRHVKGAFPFHYSPSYLFISQAVNHYCDNILNNLLFLQPEVYINGEVAMSNS